jgi:protein ImuB
MLWCALLPSSSPPAPAPSRTDGGVMPAMPDAVVFWALRFTPRVTRMDEAVLMEVQASLRLFGGVAALRERVTAEAAELAVDRLAWGGNSLMALALARAGLSDVEPMPVAERLDALPLACLSAARAHQTTLSQLGCRTLGDVRRLPRGGVARRFDKTLLHALDQLHGQVPEIPTWVTLPEHFEARLELPWRVDDGPSLMVGARRLLLQLAGWLTARHSGVTAFTLHWRHDAMRARAAGEGGQLTVRTAEATRDVDHLGRLLAEHLAQVALAAPVGDLRLQVDAAVPLATTSESWLPDADEGGESLPHWLERLAARLGEQRVLRPVLQADHRPEAMCRWQPASVPLPRTPHRAPHSTQEGPDRAPNWPQPGFLLPEPLRLMVRHDRPHYLGELQLLLGPQRLEGGWWDRDEASDEHHNVARDYWVAWSGQAGLLWVFRTRLDDALAWYLHGHFA